MQECNIQLKNNYGLNCKAIGYNQEDWLNARKLGIGGSDVGAILGVSNFKSPMQVWLDKTTETESTSNNFTKWGIILEDVIAKEFADSHPEFKIKKINKILQHNEYKFALANIDRLIINDGKKGILEIKTTSSFNKDAWQDDNIPDSYLLQVQWYMFITGTEFAYFAVLIGGNTYIEKYVEYDEELINMILPKIEHFWNENVQQLIPPEFDGSDGATDYIKNKYPAENGQEVILSNSLAAELERLDTIKELVKDLELEQKMIEQKLKNEIGENSVAFVGERKLTYKSQTRSSVDFSRLKKEKPDVSQEFVKTSEFRTLKIN